MEGGPNSLKGVFALVFEAEPDLVSQVLTYCGALVHRAGSARDVVTAADWVRPDILVCDLAAGGSAALLRELRTNGLLRGVPAVAVTTEGADVAAVRGGGFRRHLVKPFEPLALCAVVADVVEQERGEDLSPV
jgi:CheY-like chemotaxis protein